MMSEGPQTASTVLVGWIRAGLRCRWPGTVPDRQTSLAPAPPYQPIRNAFTRNERAVVDAYSVIGSPGSTLACPVYPSIASGAPKCLIGQFGSPSRELSLAVRRCAAGRAGAAGPFLPVSPEPDSFAATAATPVAPTTAKPTKARREWTDCEPMPARMARETGRPALGAPPLRH